MTDMVGAAPLGLGCSASLATGSFTSAGNDVQIAIGYNPRHFILIDPATGSKYEKFQGNAPAEYQQTVTGGAFTVPTDGKITFPADAGLNEPGSAVLLTAALVGTGKRWIWACYG